MKYEDKELLAELTNVLKLLGYEFFDGSIDDVVYVFILSHTIKDDVIKIDITNKSRLEIVKEVIDKVYEDSHN